MGMIPWDAHFPACVTGMADVVEPATHPRITHLFAHQMLSQGVSFPSLEQRDTGNTRVHANLAQVSIEAPFWAVSEQRGLALARRVFPLRADEAAVTTVSRRVGRQPRRLQGRYCHGARLAQG